jgi:drug/metabolite transporter (DMT)-like permease
VRPHFSRKLTAELFLLTTTIFWGSTFVVVKWGLADFPPLTLLALRFSLAAVLFLILFPKTWLHTDWSAIWAGGFLGLFLFLGFALQTVGLVYTTASKSAFITGLLVIFTPFVQVILERRSPTRGNLIGVGIVSLGLWFLTAPEGGSWNRGDSLTLLCAIVFSIYIVYLDIMSKKCEVLPLTMIQITAVAALSWAGVWAFENPLWRPEACVV